MRCSSRPPVQLLALATILVALISAPASGAAPSSPADTCDAPTVTLGNQCLTQTVCPTVSGGSGPYTYIWSTGETTPCITPTSTGTYTVTVTDMVGCTATDSSVVNEFPVVMMEDVCPGNDPTDSLCVVVVGGTPPYTYFWPGTGATTSCNRPNVDGNHSVVVTDAHGCSRSATALYCRTINRVPSDYPTIQSAIDAAADGDTVLVAPGVYTGPDNRDLSFHNRDIHLLSEGGRDVTTIDCEGLADGTDFDPADFKSVVIDGFTILNAVTNGIELSGSPTIRDCRVSGSGLTGIRAIGDLTLIEDCEISENGGRTGNSSPAGVYTTGTVRRCLITNNTATLGNGGIEIVGGTLEDSEITWNSGYDGGGVDATDATLSNLVISGNQATRFGGGLNTHGDVTADNCLITGNVAGLNGGGIQGFVRLRYSTVSGNYADGDGGGIWSNGVVSWSIVWGNCSAGPGYEAGANTYFECSLVDSVGVTHIWAYFDPDCVFTDPLFCDTAACNSLPTTEGTYELDPGSPALAENTPCGEPFGARGICQVVTVPNRDTPQLQTRLLPSFPNPFHSLTVIGFELTETSSVLIEVFDIRGRYVRKVLDDPTRGPGQYRTTWDGRDEHGARVTAGIYFYRMTAGTHRETRKAVLID